MRSKSASPYDAMNTPTEIATTIPNNFLEGSFSFMANEMRRTETGVNAYVGEVASAVALVDLWKTLP